MGPPSSQRDEVDQALLRDALHHEAYLVHVPVDEDPGRVRPAGPLAEDAAESIVGELSDPLEVLTDQRPHLVLGAGRAGAQGESAQEVLHFLFIATHVCFPCCCW